MEVEKQLREQLEFLQDQTQLRLQIEKQATLGGNKKVREMQWSGFEEKIVKFVGNDETGNNKTDLSQPSSLPIVYIPSVAICDVSNKRLDVSEAFRLPRGFVKWQREQSEIQKLRIVPNKGNISRRLLSYIRTTSLNLPKYNYNPSYGLPPLLI